MVTAVESDVTRSQCVEDVWLAVQSCKFPKVIIECFYRHLISLCQTYDYKTDIMKSVSLRNTSFYILGDSNDNILR